jgi:hypothetical protein
MSNRDLLLHTFSASLMVCALWLLSDFGWRAPVGILLFVWGNNLAYSYRVKKLIEQRPWR